MTPRARQTLGKQLSVGTQASYCKSNCDSPKHGIDPNKKVFWLCLKRGEASKFVVRSKSKKTYPNFLVVSPRCTPCPDAWRARRLWLLDGAQPRQRGHPPESPPVPPESPGRTAPDHWLLLQQNKHNLQVCSQTKTPQRPTP